MLQKMSLILVLMSGFSSTVFAQDTISDNSATVNASLSARKYKIILNIDKKIVAHSLDSLKRKTLYISGKRGVQEVSLDLIDELQVATKKRSVVRGLALGALLGASSGALIGLISYQKPKPDPNTNPFNFYLDFGPGFSALGGSLVGSLIGIPGGAIIGASSYRYTHYNFSKVPPAEKPALMTRILSGK